MNAVGAPQVPWFTTGCGGWLYALNSLFVQVDEGGTRLLPAVPSAIPNAAFSNLRAEQGVLVSGAFEEGRLVRLTARAPYPLVWRFRIPRSYVGHAASERNPTNGQNGFWVAFETALGLEETDLLQIIQIACARL